MRKLLLTLTFCFVAIIGVNSQTIIFDDDFETAGFPSGYSIHDVDGNTPTTNLAPVFPPAWNRLRFTGDPNWFIASTSSYTPAGTANDWVITPQISLTTGNVLSFKTRSGSSQTPDGYQLRISTTTNARTSFTTTLLTVPSESPSWTTHVVDLSAYAGQSVYLAWINNTAAGYILALDDIQIAALRTNDVEMDELNASAKYLQGTNANISAKFRNVGGDTITSVDVNWSYNGVTSSQTFSALNLKFGDSQVFNVPITISAAGNHAELKVWTSNPNGAQDSFNGNDTLKVKLLSILGNTVPKTALLEQFTTAVCQFCPDGAWVTDQIDANYQNVAVTSVHSCFGTDGMTNAEATALCTSLGNGSAPTGMVDRVLFNGEPDVAFGRGMGYPNWQNSAWATRSLAQAQQGSAVDITVSGNYNNASRQLNATVTASFVDYVRPSDFITVGLMLVEDSVVGNASNFNQSNAYNGAPGHPYAGAGNPIVNYVHKRVLRDILPATWGDPSVIPLNFSLNTNYSKSFTTNLPANYDPSKMYLIGFVSYYGFNDLSGYEVLNVEKVKMSNLITSTAERKVDLASLSIYPNPTENQSNLNFTLSKSNRVQLEVRDIAGKLILTENFGTMAKGKQLIQLNLGSFSKGFYFVNLRIGEEMVTKKITVVK